MRPLRGDSVLFSPSASFVWLINAIRCVDRRQYWMQARSNAMWARSAALSMWCHRFRLPLYSSQSANRSCERGTSLQSMSSRWITRWAHTIPKQLTGYDTPAIHNWINILIGPSQINTGDLLLCFAHKFSFDRVSPADSLWKRGRNKSKGEEKKKLF